MMNKVIACALALAMLTRGAYAANVTGLTYGADPPGISTGVVPKTNSTNNGAMSASACIDNATIWSCSEGIDVQGNAFVTEIANAGSTGTTANTLAKLTGAPSTAVIATTTDPLSAVVGIVVGGAGTTGNAQIAVAGQASCVFDGATTAGDFVGLSPSTNGDCTDLGASGETAASIGRVLSTNVSGGTYAVALNLPRGSNNIVVNGVTLPNAKFIRAAASGVSTGDTDLYTVPSNRRALIMSGACYNNSAGTIGIYPEVKIGGTYYPIGSTAGTVGTGATCGATALGYGIVLNAGEKASVHTATTNGLNVTIQVIEYDVVPGGLKSIRLAGTTTGQNTLYTVPSGYSSVVLGDMSNAGSNVASAYTGSILLQQPASTTPGASIVYDVPSGQTVGSGYEIATFTNSTANNRTRTQIGGITMAAGDFLVLNVTTGDTGQFVWINVVEQ